MTKTYAQIQKQIAALQRDAEKLKRQEVDGVIARIKEAIQVYGLT
ncbi:MAG: H-NS histone family protein, partial [Betaproteobacteria bacterium]